MKLQRVILILLALSTAFGSIAIAQEPPAAVVLGLKGKVFMETGGKKRPVEWLELIPRAAVLHLDPGSGLVMGYFESGTRETITGPAEVVIR